MAASTSSGSSLSTALLSGALAGLAGVGEVGGVHFQVMSDISPGYGYTGIVVAMLARLNPLGVVPAAIFLAAVMTGAEAMSRATGVPAFLSDVIQGTALLAMLVALLFTAYRVRRVGAAAMSAVFEQIFQVGFLAAIIRIATPLAFATLGEMFSERAGVLNLGIEGIMLLVGNDRLHRHQPQRQPVARRAGGGADRHADGRAACAVHGGARPQPACLRHRRDAVLLGPRLFPLPADLRPAIGAAEHQGVRRRCRSRSSPTFRCSGRRCSTSLRWSTWRSWPSRSAAFVLYRTPWGLSVRMVGENPRAADFGRRQRHRHALPGGDPRRRADGAGRRVPDDGAVQRLHLRRRVGARLGGDRAGRLRPLGSRGARRARRCCSPSSMRLQLRMQASGLGHIPYEAFLMLPFIFTIVAMALMSRNAVAPVGAAQAVSTGRAVRARLWVLTSR